MLFQKFMVKKELMKKERTKIKSRNARRSIIGVGDDGAVPGTSVSNAADHIIVSSDVSEKQHSAPKKVAKIDDYIRNLSALSAIPS